MPQHAIRLVTRRSPLALYQAHFVRDQLLAHHANLQVDIIAMTTIGDQSLATSLSTIGGKGLFVKELETALLTGTADIAVHSMKDVPAQLPDGLGIYAMCQRIDPRDALLCNQYDQLSKLPANAIVGTTSLRRQSQLKALRSDLKVKNLRGNVGTRISKLDAGEYDAIILAAAGLERLQLQTRIKHYFTTTEMLPAIGQAALGIECRHNDTVTQQHLQPLNDPNTITTVNAERTINAMLGGDCRSPLAAHAQLEQHTITIKALVACADGTEILSSQKVGPRDNSELLAQQVADELIAQGALQILAQCQR